MVLGWATQSMVWPSWISSKATNASHIHIIIVACVRWGVIIIINAERKIQDVILIMSSVWKGWTCLEIFHCTSMLKIGQSLSKTRSVSLEGYGTQHDARRTDCKPLLIFSCSKIRFQNVHGILLFMIWGIWSTLRWSLHFPAVTFISVPKYPILGCSAAWGQKRFLDKQWYVPSWAVYSSHGQTLKRKSVF